FFPFYSLILNSPLDARSALIWSMTFSGVSAFGISYTSAWCVRVTSSTTYSMVGALNKLPVAASGMIFFGDLVTFAGVSAILVGFIAGLVYAVAKVVSLFFLYFLPLHRRVFPLPLLTLFDFTATIKGGQARTDRENTHERQQPE